MKRYFARVFAVHPLALLAGLCLLPLAGAGSRWLWLAPGASERAARGAAQELAAGLVPPVLTWLTNDVAQSVQSMAGTVNGIPAMAHSLIDDARKDVADKAQQEIRHGVDLIAGPEGQV